MRRQYSLEWELLPADAVANAFYRNPSGHIEAGRPFSLASYFEEITPGVFETISIEPDASALYTFTVSGKADERILSLYDVLDPTREVRHIIGSYGVETATVALYTDKDGVIQIECISGCEEDENVRIEDYH